MLVNRADSQPSAARCVGRFFQEDLLAEQKDYTANVPNNMYFAFCIPTLA
jgi:hypothetical protein